MSTDDPYLIWSHEHAAWWRGGGGGYTPQLSEAGRYSRDDAMFICIRAMPGAKGALNELPVRAADVEAMVYAYRAEFHRQDSWM